jgi:hypothetical protein
MLKSVLGTATLLAGWSALWFAYVVYFGGNHVSNAILNCSSPCELPVSDDGPQDIALWVIGLVAIVAFRVWLHRGPSR